MVAHNCIIERPQEITLEAKNGSSVTVDCTKEHSTMSGTPLSPFKHASPKTAPAYLDKHKMKYISKKQIMQKSQI
jgi:hypothetical protein